MSSTIQVKTAVKALEIIEVIDELNGCVIEEVMEAMDMAKSTTYDHLLTLRNLGYVIKTGEEYYLSTKFLELGEKRRRRMRIYQSSRPEIEKLAEKTGEHAGLTIEENDVGVLLALETGEDALQLSFHAGKRFPLPVTAPGKAILANLPEERTESILAEYGIPAATRNTITDHAHFSEELKTIREQGYAIDNEEHVLGVRAISVPVICQGEVLGAITIGGPVQRLTDERMANKFPPMILEAANVIEVNYIHSE